MLLSSKLPVLMPEKRSQEEEFGGSARTSQEKGEAQCVANPSPCVRFLAGGQNEGQEGSGSVPFVSSDHVENVFGSVPAVPTPHCSPQVRFLQRNCSGPELPARVHWPLHYRNG